MVKLNRLRTFFKKVIPCSVLNKSAPIKEIGAVTRKPAFNKSIAVRAKSTGELIPLVLKRTKNGNAEEILLSRMADNSPVGLMTINHGSKSLYLKRIDADPEAGLSGVGTELNKILKEIAKKEGYTCIKLDACGTSHLFHFKQGFRCAEEIFHSDMPGILKRTLKSNDPIISRHRDELEKLLISARESLSDTIAGKTKKVNIVKEFNKTFDEIMKDALKEGKTSKDIGFIDEKGDSVIAMALKFLDKVC